VSPAELFYDKPASFDDSVDPKTHFDVTILKPWYNCNDHGLVQYRIL
jgi:hypothetical protein